MSGPRLRNATAGDVDALVALWRACGLAFRRQAVDDELAGRGSARAERLRVAHELFDWMAKLFAHTPRAPSTKATDRKRTGKRKEADMTVEHVRLRSGEVHCADLCQAAGS